MTDEYLLAWIEEAKRRYEAALPTATDAQRVVWQYVSRDKFVEEAWPYAEPDIVKFGVVARAMTFIVESGLTPEAALTHAKRDASKSDALPPSFVRDWESRWHKRASERR